MIEVDKESLVTYSCALDPRDKLHTTTDGKMVCFDTAGAIHVYLDAPDVKHLIKKLQTWLEPPDRPEGQAPTIAPGWLFLTESDAQYLTEKLQGAQS